MLTILVSLDRECWVIIFDHCYLFQTNQSKENTEACLVFFPSKIDYNKNSFEKTKTKMLSQSVSKIC